ncbi:MAG: biotin/lipoate A/B protein ligase family protein [Candidatus Lutacidiplasmatales archaeon]
MRFDGALSPIANNKNDSALLAEGGPGVRTAVLDELAVSLGVAQPADTPSASAARDRGIPVLRRLSGGTSVLHSPGDIAWAVVLRRDHPLAGARFVQSYGPLGRGVVSLLGAYGIRAEWADAIGLSEELCLLASRGRVLSVRSRALGGAAQRVTREALLHHGVVDLSIDRGLLADLFRLPRSLLESRMTSLRELGVTTDPVELARQLGSHLADALSE